MGSEGLEDSEDEDDGSDDRKPAFSFKDVPLPELVLVPLDEALSKLDKMLDLKNRIASTNTNTPIKHEFEQEDLKHLDDWKRRKGMNTRGYHYLAPCNRVCGTFDQVRNFIEGKPLKFKREGEPLNSKRSK